MPTLYDVSALPSQSNTAIKTSPIEMHGQRVAPSGSRCSLPTVTWLIDDGFDILTTTVTIWDPGSAQGHR